MLIKSNIELSKHALLQIGYRGISIQTLLDCIDQPDDTVQQSDNRLRLIKKINHHDKKYLLIVIGEQQQNHLIIVTAFITSKITKYI